MPFATLSYNVDPGATSIKEMLNNIGLIVVNIYEDWQSVEKKCPLIDWEAV